MDTDWLFDIEEDISQERDELPQPPLVRLALDSLIMPEDRVLHDWIGRVFPFILDHLSLEGAKGLSIEATRPLIPDGLTEDKAEEIVKKFEALDDQSMAVHLLNATLSGWSLVKLAKLDETEQRLYLAGVTLHDLNKIALSKLGELRLDGEDTTKYTQSFEAWGTKLNLWEFISKGYWQDAAFLAQNAEVSRGENRTFANYPDAKLTPGKLEKLAPFVYFADLAASIAKNPKDLPEETRAQDIVRRVLRNQYELTYHSTSDNRGLLTQLIHNAVLEKATEVEWIPILFFPKGITYLRPVNALSIDLAPVPQLVRNAIMMVLRPRIQDFIVHDRTKAARGGQYDEGILEIADLQTICSTLISYMISRIGEKSKIVIGERREKLLDKAPKLANELGWDYPIHRHADIVAESFAAINRVVANYYSKKGKASSQEQCRVALRLILALGMKEHAKAWTAIESKEYASSFGGTAHGWYYIGGHFAKKHSAVSDAELEERMNAAVDEVLRKMEKIKNPPESKAFSFLEDYVPQTLHVTQANEHAFAGELEAYEKGKATSGGKKTICTICSGTTEVKLEQMGYTNRRVASITKDSNKRGICALCRLDQLLLGKNLDYKRSGVSDKRKEAIVYLHLYPNYFFTPETSRLMNRAYEDFAASRFSNIEGEMREHNYRANWLVRADIFRIHEDPSRGKRFSTEKLEYPPHHLCSYFLTGLPFTDPKGPDANITDTETWAMPALLALFTPIVFGTKVVASRSALPPFDSGGDFRETVVLDEIHPFWKHGMRLERLRLDQLALAVPAALSLYSIISQTSTRQTEKGDVTSWNMLNEATRKVATGPLSLFSYADRISQQQSRRGGVVTTTSGMRPQLANRLVGYYEHLTSYYTKYKLGDTSSMNLVRDLVESYTKFYQASGFAAYARVRPLDIAIKATLDIPPSLDKDEESFKLQITGRLLKMLQGIRSDAVKGYLPGSLWKNEHERIEPVENFVDLFFQRVFREYCQGERALLRERSNLLRNGCEAYYVKKYGKQADKSSQNEPPKQENHNENI